MITAPFKFAVALIATFFIAGVFGAGWMVRGHMADAEVAKIIAKYESEKRAAAEQYAHSIEKARKEAAYTQKLIQEAQDAEIKKREAAEAARRRADVNARSLRDDLQATRAELAALKDDPFASPRCKAAAASGAMCADLLGRCSERRRELAEFAESSARAGELCVQSYEALTP
jgi:hypothetical protein